MRIVRRRVSRVDRASAADAAPLLDRQLSYLRSGELWSFQSGRILIGGKEVNSLLAQNEAVSFWVSVAEGLREYRQHVAQHRRVPSSISQFYGMVDALLEKVYSGVRDRYAEKASGLIWKWVDGQFLLNDLNVGGFFAMYKTRRTRKGWRFLKGLQGKLALLLEGRGSSELEKVRSIVQHLYEEICRELSRDPPPDPGSSLKPGGN